MKKIQKRRFMFESFAKIGGEITYFSEWLKEQEASFDPYEWPSDTIDFIEACEFYAGLDDAEQ